MYDQKSVECIYDELDKLYDTLDDYGDRILEVDPFGLVPKRKNELLQTLSKEEKTAYYDRRQKQSWRSKQCQF